MTKWFATSEVYNERMQICKECNYYFKLTGNCKVCGCFMKIKSRIGSMSCPKGKWGKTSDKIKTPENLPQEIIDEIINLYPDIKGNRAKNHEVKFKMIDLYNTIHRTHHERNVSCSSCLSTIFKSMYKLYNKYKPNE
ncbi:MAG: hypothetical protein Unbinned3065contig1007_14 [Prokaryotic dsDNA virus sp.]|nr:MAG: hypothetical protein Unbinned3065contig1007_14 [Prokaryotic dsDNA virus sp.]|tara:strand:- start:9361 stop:9771 length:411 start_codon:yes stop_codon:yes gene_type:complete